MIKVNKSVYKILHETDKAYEIQNDRGHCWIPKKALSPHGVTFTVDDWFIQVANREQMYILHLEHLIKEA